MFKFTRRKFMEVVIGGITLSLTASKTAKIVKTEAPATTLLGRELTRPKLLPEGWHTVVIKNIEFKPSKLNPDDTNIWFECETVFEPKTYLYKIISTRAPEFAMQFINQLGLPQTHDSILLNDAIGKQVKVEIKHREYNNKTVMSVT